MTATEYERRRANAAIYHGDIDGDGSLA